MSGWGYVRPVSTFRTFIVRISDAPRRVVVEDVRERRSTVAQGLGEVGVQIEAWLASGAAEEPNPDREDSVSPPP